VVVAAQQSSIPSKKVFQNTFLGIPHESRITGGITRRLVKRVLKHADVKGCGLVIRGIVEKRRKAIYALKS
jgi:hypothetical protein